MRLYNDLTAVFCNDLFKLTRHGGIVEINEADKNASVRRAELECHGKIMSISTDIFNKTDSFYNADADTKVGMPKLQHGCDGVLVIEKGDSHYIVFIELKSDYSNGNIRKAEMQICASYLRVMALLNTVDSDDISKYKKCGIIVSHPLDDADKTLIMKKKNAGKRLSRYERQCLVFASNRLKCFPISKKYSQLDKIPVKDCLRFDELPAYHINVNINSASERFNLENILKDL